MKFHPFISGSGMAGKGMAKALSIIGIVDGDIKFGPITQLKRSQSLKGLTAGVENPLLLIANTHGFHAQLMLDGLAEGFKHIVVDKPVCVSRDDLPRLKAVKNDIAVCHGFRQNWGPQAMKKMIDAGEAGEIISIEGRYWQSSFAQDALAGVTSSTKDWKSDPKINGPYDAMVDLGAHYTDLIFFLAGGTPTQAHASISHINSPAPHRDSHAWLEFQFPKFAARGSVSKTVHGTGNDLEVTVIGSKAALTWGMERSDELRVARGATTTILQKPSDRFGSQQPPFHGMGWIEGYIEIIHNYLMAQMGHRQATYPTLQDSVRVMETLLGIEPSRIGFAK